MSIFQYKCQKCRAVFESMETSDLVCISCGASDVGRSYESVFAKIGGCGVDCDKCHSGLKTGKSVGCMAHRSYV